MTRNEYVNLRINSELQKNPNILKILIFKAIDFIRGKIKISMNKILKSLIFKCVYLRMKLTRYQILKFMVFNESENRIQT